MGTNQVGIPQTEAIEIPKGAKGAIVSLYEWLQSPGISEQLTAMQDESIKVEEAALMRTCVARQKNDRGEYDLDQAMHDEINTQIVLVKRMEKQIEAGFALAEKPLADIVNYIRRAKASVIGPLANAEAHYKGEILAYHAEHGRQAARIQREETERLRREEEERRAKEAVSAEGAGIQSDAAARIMDAPQTRAVPQFAPAPPKAAGVGQRENWVFEFDANPENDPNATLRQLVKLAGCDDRYLPYLLANTSNLNRDAKTQKTLMQIPGVGHAVNKGTVAVRI